MPWSRRRSRNSVTHLAYVVAAVGAIAMIALSLAGFFGLTVTLPFKSPLPTLFGGALVALILGVVAFVGSKHVGELVWAVALIAIGYIGGGIGGLLVLVGGVLGVISRYAHR